MDEEQILKEFTENVTGYFTVSTAQREEIDRSFLYMDNHSVDSEGSPASFGSSSNVATTPKSKRSANISLLPAIVRGVAGSEVMQERHIDIVPIEGKEYDVEMDIMDDAVSYAQYASNWKSNFDIAKRDAAICGIGATITNLDMTKRNYPSGIPKCDRKHPSFLFYDTSGRGQDLNDTANWCGYVDPMKTDDLQDYVERKLGKKAEVSDVGAAGDSGFAAQFMLGKNNADTVLDMLYHYFWKQDEAVYDTENLINTDEVFAQIMQQDEIAVEIMGQWAKFAKVDIAAPLWTLDKEQYKELNKTLEAITELTGEEFEVKKSQRDIKCFYRAEIGLGQVLSWSKAYSQKEFPLNFVTGYFDESMGVYYGFTRPISFIQDALNIVMDDLLEYSHGAATGGKVWVKGGADDIKLIKQAQADKEDITPIPENAEIIAKQLASTPQVLLSTAQMLIELMPRSIGVGQEFLGIITTGKMTDSLFGRIVRQSFAVLQDFTNNSAGYSRRQGYLFIDLITSVAHVEDGRILPILSPGHSPESYFKLSKQNIAREYAIRVMERPTTDDERMENMKMLTQLAPALQQQGANIMPAIIENMRIDYNEKEELKKMVVPPNPQPDPLNQKAAEANIEMISAQAAKLRADAKAIESTLGMQPDKMKSEINKNTSTAMKNVAQADAASEDSAMKLISTLNQVRI